VAAAGWADGLFDELSKDFGSVPHGQLLTHNFRIANTTRNPVNISHVRVSCGCTSAVVNRGYLNPGEETTLTARMDSSVFFGVRTVTIFVNFDRPGFDEVRLWVQANSRSDFVMTPHQMAFGQIKRGSGPTATVSITFYGNQGARITEVKGESNYVQPSLQEQRRSDGEVTYQLTAKLRPDTPVGKWYTDLWVKTNVATMAQLRVPLTVEIESALSVSPEVINLGSVKVGAEVEKKVIVRGVKPFKLAGLEGEDAELAVKDSTTDAKAVHVLTVRLKPSKAGDFGRTVRVRTDLPDDGQTDFRVTAQVTP
jgi:hypothetical protein